MCQDIENEIVVANVERVETQTLTPLPTPVATPAGNVDVTHFGSIGDPLPGVYMVIASSRDLAAARSFTIQSSGLAPQVFAMPAGGRRVMYHMIVGPMTQNDYTSARESAVSHGFRNTWALMIDEGDWRLARELEARERARLSVERASVVQ
ncbi:MAG: hypothetical protein JJ900_05645 [Rhodospirillales bacterium]|nr:hypothetical protein [Rhodospirillales bacterium]MBO6786317.1 hypothetical protein [Rhodospirillales bacterium]